MSKRSAESRIITYFEQAPLASAEIVLGIVKEKVKARRAETQPAPALRKQVRRRKRADSIPSQAEAAVRLAEAVAQ